MLVNLVLNEKEIDYLEVVMTRTGCECIPSHDWAKKIFPG
jgi:hypothetical protein